MSHECQSTGDCALCLAAAEDVLARSDQASLRPDTPINLEWGWGKLHLSRLEDSKKSIDSSNVDSAFPVSFDLDGYLDRVPEWIGRGIVAYADACREVKEGLKRLEKVCCLVVCGVVMICLGQGKEGLVACFSAFVESEGRVYEASEGLSSCDF